MLGCGGVRFGTSVPEPGGEILLLGCEGAGKTLLCRQLERLCAGNGTADECNTSTVPSIGTELLTLRCGKRAAAVREVGGAMRAVWGRYYSACAACAFVADVSNLASAGSAVVEWYALLSEPSLGGKPLLLILNQVDRNGALTMATLRQLFRLAECTEAEGGRVKVVAVSARTCEGVTAVRNWLMDGGQLRRDDGSK